MKSQTFVEVMVVFCCVYTILAQEQWTWTDLTKLDHRLQKFARLLKSKGGEHLQLEKIRPTFGKAIESGQSCFQKNMDGYGELLKKFNNDITNLIENSSGPNGEIQRALVSYVIQLAQHPRHGFGTALERIMASIPAQIKIGPANGYPEIQRDLSEMETKLTHGFNSAYPCIMESIQNDFKDKPEALDILMKVWEKSGQGM